MSVLGLFILPSITVLQLSSQVKADLCGPSSGWMFEIRWQLKERMISLLAFVSFDPGTADYIYCHHIFSSVSSVGPKLLFWLINYTVTCT